MTIEDLTLEKTSVITPIRAKGVDHFVVVKAIVAGHVVMADPGFGNMTMRVDQFQKLWKNGIVFVVHPPDERMIVEKNLSIASRLVPDETVITRKIGGHRLLPIRRTCSSPWVCRSGQLCGGRDRRSCRSNECPYQYGRLQVLLNSYLQPLATGCASR